MPVFSYDTLQLNKGRGFVKCCTQGNNSEQEFNANIKAASQNVFRPKYLFLVEAL